ncbi:hypothetical protein OFR41_08210 [Brachyspira hyodysenteriae]|nr:hypothetical protein [Brachyspira hyodysenteriae]MDA0006657.1 hypothetical protein [Brachyspira hyodysenteriae]MDA0049176.1 hypothetical protein [Brachyspira hyodysenteriae]MDA1470292.1 hypothetical protein [Brachyspira hyodysenteriae]
MNFSFYMPSKVIFGCGSLEKLHKQKLPGKSINSYRRYICKKIRIFKKIGRTIR